MCRRGNRTTRDDGRGDEAAQAAAATPGYSSGDAIEAMEKVERQMRVVAYGDHAHLTRLNTTTVMRPASNALYAKDTDLPAGAEQATSPRLSLISS
jgi:hypothetical protein